MTETIHIPEQRSGSELEDQLVKFDELISPLDVPSVSMLAEAALADKGIHQISENEYVEESGVPIDADLVNRFKQKTNPDTWMMQSSEEVDAAEHIKDAESIDDLSEDQYRDLRDFMGEAGIEDTGEAFNAYKDYVGQRLSLHEALTDLKEEAETEQPQQSQEIVPVSTRIPTVEDINGTVQTKETSPIVGNNLRGATERHSKKIERSDTQYDDEGTLIISEAEKAKMRKIDADTASDIAKLLSMTEWSEPTLHGEEATNQEDLSTDWGEATHYRASNSIDRLKDRFMNKMRQAYNKLQDLKMNAVDYYSDEEKGQLRRKYLGVALGAGALAAAGIYYFATKDGSMGGGTPKAHEAAATHPHGAGAGHHATVEAQPVIHNESLHAGHTIIGDLREYAQKHGIDASDKSLMKAAKSVLKENHMSWKDARHMPVDSHYNINQHIYDQLLKRNK